MSFVKIDKSTSHRSSTVSTCRSSLASETGSVSRRPSEGSLTARSSSYKESNPPVVKPAHDNPLISLSTTRNRSSAKLDKRNPSRSSSLVPTRRSSLSSLSAHSYTSNGTSQAFTELTRRMKAASSARPHAVLFRPEYKSSSEAYKRLPPTERNAIFVEVTFFTDETQKEVSLRADSLFVPQRHPFELQKGTPAYEYAEMIARSALAKHAAQGILKAGRTYGWLPLLFKVKAIEQSPRYKSERQVLADVESIPVAYDDVWC